MATREGLYFQFWFQNVIYIFLGKVTKFQEKGFVVSDLCSKLQGGGG